VSSRVPAVPYRGRQSGAPADVGEDQSRAPGRDEAAEALEDEEAVIFDPGW
jgi:hypothetical protein